MFIIKAGSPTLSLVLPFFSRHTSVRMSFLLHDPLPTRVAGKHVYRVLADPVSYRPVKSGKKRKKKHVTTRNTIN